jgi:DNA-binding IclR family transcriptional regulator
MPRSRSVQSERVVRLPVRGRPRSAGRPPVGIRAVDIGLEIVNCIVASGAGLSLSALSRETGVKPSKLHRYLVSLTRHGLLMQAPVTGLYDLGPHARRIGVAALNRFDEMTHVHQVVSAFVAQTGHAIAVYVWTDLGPTLIRMEIGTQSFPVLLRVGSALPLCTSATGRVFLAYMPETVTRGLVEREHAVAAAGGHALRAFDEELRNIKSDLIYVTNEAIFPGIVVVGPILDTRGDLFCTLTAIAPRDSTSEQRRQLAIDLRRLVESCSRELFGNSSASPDRLEDATGARKP